MFELDFSDVKPSVLNWIIVGLMAVTFIAVTKYLVTKYDNPVTEFVRPIFVSV